MFRMYIDGKYSVTMDGMTLDYLRELVARDTRKGSEFKQGHAEDFLACVEPVEGSKGAE